MPAKSGLRINLIDEAIPGAEVRRDFNVAGFSCSIVMFRQVLDPFSAATHALVIVTLRDTTFEAHRDEPPLDAFINAVSFYIKPPRFGAMIKKRLEIALDDIRTDPELFEGAEVHPRIGCPSYV
jgi:hypothetical protein